MDNFQRYFIVRLPTLSNLLLLSIVVLHVVSQITGFRKNDNGLPAPFLSIMHVVCIFRGFIKHGYYWTLHGPAQAASAHFSSFSCSSWTFVHDCKFYGGLIHCFSTCSNSVPDLLLFLVPLLHSGLLPFTKQSSSYTPASYLSQSNHPLFHFAAHTSTISIHENNIMDDTVDLYHIKQYPILQWRRQVQIHKGSAWIRFDSIPHNGLDYYVWSIQSTPKKHGTSSQVAHHENQFIIESRHMCQGTEWTDGRSPMSCLIGPCSMYPMIFKTFRIIYTVLLYPMILAQGQDRIGHCDIVYTALLTSERSQANYSTLYPKWLRSGSPGLQCTILYCTGCTFMNTSKWKCMCVYCICVSLLCVLPVQKYCRSHLFQMAMHLIIVDLTWLDLTHSSRLYSCDRDHHRKCWKTFCVRG